MISRACVNPVISAFTSLPLNGVSSRIFLNQIDK